jgi:hypothetical protein
MATRATATWLTASLYYNGPWEYFLAKAIKPYVDVVLQTGVAERFFFERGWQGSPYARLYFKGNSDVLHHILKPNLQEHFQQYFEASPHAISDAQTAIGPSNAPNRVSFDGPGPAASRYGGQLELELCEKQFQASSMMALASLKEKYQHWNHNELISTAIKLHLSFAYSVGLSMEEAARFFQFLELDWMANNLQGSSGAQDADTLHYFRQVFDSQQEDIVSYHAALWEIFKNYHKTEDKQYIDWFHVNSNTAVELGLALDNAVLRTQPGLFPDEQFNSPTDARLWNFFADFVRLTNNRLGIAGKQEGYLYFAMSKSLRCATGTYRKNYNKYKAKQKA